MSSFFSVFKIILLGKNRNQILTVTGGNIQCFLSEEPAAMSVLKMAHEWSSL